MGKGLLPREGCWRPETEGTTSVKLVCILTARKQGWLRRLQRLLKKGKVLEGGKIRRVVKLLGWAIEMLVQEEIRQGLRSLILGLAVGLGQNLRKGKPAKQLLIRGLVLQWVPLCLDLAVPLLLKTMEKAQERWVIFYKGKIIPIGDTMINMIKRDPTEVMGWFEWELMQAWRNLFPLTDLSHRTSFLPITDEAWSLTPNPW